MRISYGLCVSLRRCLGINEQAKNDQCYVNLTRRVQSVLMTCCKVIVLRVPLVWSASIKSDYIRVRGLKAGAET